MAKQGKRYRAALDNYELTQAYAPEEAVELIKKNATAKFDETVELHIRTGRAIVRYAEFVPLDVCHGITPFSANRHRAVIDASEARSQGRRGGKGQNSHHKSRMSRNLSKSSRLHLDAP